MNDNEIKFVSDTEKPNYLFIAITIAMCLIFGGLQWLFLQQVRIDGMFESWVVRGALMLSVVLTGVMIYFKFGRANEREQNIVLWIGLAVEMVVMGFTFIVVIHPDVLAGTDIEGFARFVSGLNAITTVFTLIIYFALDTRAQNAYKVEKERQRRIHQMQLNALDSKDINDMVKAAVSQQVSQQLAKDLGVLPHQMSAMSRNGTAHPEAVETNGSKQHSPFS